MNRFVAAVAAIGLVATPSMALANVEIGGTAGFHMFSENNGLGVGKMEDATSQKNSALFGIRLGVFFQGMFGVEGEFGVIPSEARSILFSVYNITYRGHAVVQLRAKDPENVFVPFLFAGGGVMQVYKSDEPNEIKEESMVVPYAGLGVKYRAANNWGLRADARALFPESSDPDASRALDVEILLSLYKEFGRPSKVEEAPPPPPPVKDEDPDKDGVIGAADSCPNEPEDKDSFEDENGCPDPDNDGDGVGDADDKCASEPEDKDNFEDDNGCPDPDNDGDGVPDAADKCGTEPETKNGYQDDDGCPDEIPEKLKKFTGVIQGITFKVNSAALAGASAKTLDKAVAVLAEFKDIKLEIQGHTDDQPLKKGGKFADNTELSQARAETVKAYFVSKGIDESRLTARGYGDSAPIEDPKGLKGGKLNAARAKNRRVEFKLISSEAEKPADEKPAEESQDN
ncbi:MAG: OmpA family protein [Kofleriaceae bacterium]